VIDAVTICLSVKLIIGLLDADSVLLNEAHAFIKFEWYHYCHRKNGLCIVYIFFFYKTALLNLYSK
jgi:hypothetical protein